MGQPTNPPQASSSAGLAHPPFPWPHDDRARLFGPGLAIIGALITGIVILFIVAATLSTAANGTNDVADVLNTGDLGDPTVNIFLPIAAILLGVAVLGGLIRMVLTAFDPRKQA